MSAARGQTMGALEAEVNPASRFRPVVRLYRESGARSPTETPESPTVSRTFARICCTLTGAPLPVPRRRASFVNIDVTFREARMVYHTAGTTILSADEFLIHSAANERTELVRGRIRVMTPVACLGDRSGEAHRCCHCRRCASRVARC